MVRSQPGAISKVFTVSVPKSPICEIFQKIASFCIKKCMQTACERNTSSASKSQARISTCSRLYMRYHSPWKPFSGSPALGETERGEKPLEGRTDRNRKFCLVLCGTDRVRACRSRRKLRSVNKVGAPLQRRLPWLVQPRVESRS
jgi:hypothetical protein